MSLSSFFVFHPHRRYRNTCHALLTTALFLLELIFENSGIPVVYVFAQVSTLEKISHDTTRVTLNLFVFLSELKTKLVANGCTGIKEGFD